jgi:hypothetical protein
VPQEKPSATNRRSQQTARAASQGPRARLPHASSLGVSSASFSPDGVQIVTASRDGTARLWDATTGKEIIALRGHEEWVWSASQGALRASGAERQCRDCLWSHHDRPTSSSPSAADVTDIAALQNSENCDPPCGAPVPVCCRLGIPVLRSLSPNEGHTAPSTDDALLDQALGSAGEAVEIRQSHGQTTMRNLQQFLLRMRSRRGRLPRIKWRRPLPPFAADSTLYRTAGGRIPRLAIFGALIEESGSHETRRWREMDSNHRSPVSGRHPSATANHLFSHHLSPKLG